MTDDPPPLVTADEAEAWIAERDVAVDDALAELARGGGADAPPAPAPTRERSPSEG